MQTTISIPSSQDIFLSQFRLQEEKHGSAQPEWLNTQRREAIQHFQDIGFPTTHDEDWRFTSVSPITQTAFQSPEVAGISIPARVPEPVSPGATQLVFINGLYSVALSNIPNFPSGILVGNLRSLLADPRSSDILRVYLGRTISYQQHPFAALNSALWLDGACIVIPNSVVVKDPIHILHLSTAGETPIASHPRTLIVCERDSQTMIVETYLAGSEGICFSNAVTEVVAGENAIIDLYKSVHENFRSFHIGLSQVYAGRGAQVSALTASLGGALVRNEVHAVLDAEGADCTLNGLYAAKGVQHVDNHTTVDHAKPHGSSRQFYNGILNGYATAVFSGRIIVRPDAQKTDANQKNRNLLLSADATIDTKPQLEISANDVRCTHGATVGQMDPEALFFLRSRGLDREEAVSLLVQAFASEILDKVKVPAYRSWLENDLQTSFLDAPMIARN